MPPQFNSPEALSSASDKAKNLAKNFSKNSNLNDSGISIPVFTSRTNSRTKIFKKAIINLDSSKASQPDCIPVVVLSQKFHTY